MTAIVSEFGRVPSVCKVAWLLAYVYVGVVVAQSFSFFLLAHRFSAARSLALPYLTKQFPKKMSGEDYKFEGWMGLGPESADGKMVWQEFPKDRKPFAEEDVDIQITHSGICGSDLHTLRSGWGPTPYVCFLGSRLTTLRKCMLT
jgi:hypothetical protein